MKDTQKNRTRLFKQKYKITNNKSPWRPLNLLRCQQIDVLTIPTEIVCTAGAGKANEKGKKTLICRKGDAANEMFILLAVRYYFTMKFMEKLKN